jgi:putative ABC transport system permease protein
MNKDWTVRVTPMLEFETARVRPTLYALFAAAAVLLLIACANLSGLLLVRTSARRREIAVRAALGASRGRIARQLLVESLVLAAIGGLLGLLAAKWGVSGLLRFAPADFPRASEVAMSGHMVAICLGASLLLGLAFGFLPAWYGTRIDLGKAVQGANRNATEPRGAVLCRNVLVVSQFAFALVLLSGAGLLLRSFARLSHANPGFNPDSAVTLSVYSHNREAEKQIAFTDNVLSRFKALPGVTAAGATVFAPFSGPSTPRLLQIEHHDVPPPARPGVIHYPVTTGYFGAMEIPLLEGRAFTGQDRPGTPSVAIVSQSIVDRFFHSADVIGQRIKFDGDSEPWREIVGVVGDLRTKDYRSEMVPQVYVPFAQSPSAVVTFVVRADDTKLSALPSSLRFELGKVAPELPVFRMVPLKQLIGESMARERFSMILVSAFAGVALALAATGMFGVISYSVSMRRREFGIRIALGARPTDLVRFVLAGGMCLVTAGLIAGVAGALIATELVRTLLYETASRDPVILTTAAVLLSSVALLACWLPARRAARVDPIEALRCE